MMLSNLLNILDKIIDGFQAKFTENWVNLTILGNYHNQQKPLFNELVTAFTALNIQSALSFFIETDNYSFDNFINEIQNGDNWRININKDVLIRKEQIDGMHQNFFYSQKDFFNWSSNANPFEEAHPFNSYSPIKIIVKDINCYFGGPNILVCNQNNFDSTFAEANTQFPTNGDILDVVHVTVEKPFCIHLEKHLITFGKPEESIPNDFLKNSSKIL